MLRAYPYSIDNRGEKLPKIVELPGHVADLIAAGEVVERPASVIKELIENSLDAGATAITVELNAGGMTYMRVTDNGCGVAPEEAATAFLRHATSKLSGPEGLEAIGTLGFRGEALAAIAAVSKIEFFTREHGREEGIGLKLDAGVITESSPAGCPEGTTVIVRDLFFNTPARLKFMKSDRAEGASAANTVLRCALSRPDVSFRFIKDGKTEFHTPGDTRADSAVYSLLGSEFLDGFLKAESADIAVAVDGFISKPSSSRGNRNYQFFFVNGRHIRSKTLQAALEQAYVNTLPPGRYPACVLYITIRHGDVDVNVHPAKTEIKFVSDKQVFDCVYYAALGALTQLGKGAEAESPIVRETVSHGELFLPVSDTQSTAPLTAHINNSGGGFKSMSAEDFHKSYNPNGFKTTVPPDTERGVNAPVCDETIGTYQTQYSLPSEDDPKPLTGDSLRVIGEALGTYILAEYQGSVWFIDKHAVHERVHFNALKSGEFEPMSQALIAPIICRHGHEDTQLLLENAELLDKLGFTIESMGDDAIAVRRIPSEIDLYDAESVLSEICAELKRGKSSQPVRHDNILRSVACKAAIKAGKSSDIRELEELAKRVVSGEITHCQHGRPVSFEMSKTALDRSFKRI